MIGECPELHHGRSPHLGVCCLSPGPKRLWAAHLALGTEVRQEGKSLTTPAIFPLNAPAEVMPRAQTVFPQHQYAAEALSPTTPNSFPTAMSAEQSVSFLGILKVCGRIPNARQASRFLPAWGGGGPCSQQISLSHQPQWSSSIGLQREHLMTQLQTGAGWRCNLLRGQPWLACVLTRLTTLAGTMRAFWSAWLSTWRLPARSTPFPVGS